MLNGTSTSYTVDTANHLTSVGGVSVIVDANGNLTDDGQGNSYCWDVRGRLVQIKHNGVITASFTYNTDGIRTSETINGVTTHFTIDHALCVLDNNATDSSPTLTTFGPAGAFCRGVQYYTPDAVGSIATVTDTSGNHIQHNQYGVFGQQVTDNLNSGNPLGFLGGMSDPNGLMNVGGSVEWSSSLGQSIGSFSSGSSGSICTDYEWLAQGLKQSIDITLTVIGGVGGGFAGGAGGAALGTALAGATGGAGAAVIPAATATGAAGGTALGALAGHGVGQLLGEAVADLIRFGTRSRCRVMQSSGSSGGAGGGGGRFPPPPYSPGPPAPGQLLVVDEQLPAQTAALLEQRGYNAVSALRAFGGQGAGDETITDALQSWGGRIITKNYSDFASDPNLVYPIEGGNLVQSAQDVVDYLVEYHGF